MGLDRDLVISALGIKFALYGSRTKSMSNCGPCLLVAFAISDFSVARLRVAVYEAMALVRKDGLVALLAGPR